MSENLHHSASETFEGSGKPFLTNSMVDLFARCPHAFYLSYVKGIKKAPGLALIRGRSVHSAGDHNFSQKIESFVDLPPKDVVDFAVSKFETTVENEEIGFSQEEVRRGVSIVKGEAVDQVAAHAEVLAFDLAPNYQPLSVEQSVELSLPGRDYDVRGTLDLRSIDPRDVEKPDAPETLTDFKTAGRKKSQSDADQSTQLSLYSCLYKSEFGKFPDRLELATTVVSKTKAEKQILETERGEGHYQALTKRFDVIWECIKSGNFPPASPMGWWCSPGWCGYWSDCEFVCS
jgi:hypothetical protein